MVWISKRRCISITFRLIAGLGDRRKRTVYHSRVTPVHLIYNIPTYAYVGSRPLQLWSCIQLTCPALTTWCVAFCAVNPCGTAVWSMHSSTARVICLMNAGTSAPGVTHPRPLAAYVTLTADMARHGLRHSHLESHISNYDVSIMSRMVRSVGRHWKAVASGPVVRQLCCGRLDAGYVERLEDV